MHTTTPTTIITLAGREYTVLTHAPKHPPHPSVFYITESEGEGISPEEFHRRALSTSEYATRYASRWVLGERGKLKNKWVLVNGK